MWVSPLVMAYDYQLLIKHVFEYGKLYAPKQEIVYRDIHRYTYTDLYKRVHRLANALEELGVKKGTRVGVLEWDSHRYLECYFAIPMMGAVLHTVNVRLSPEDIAYTINHAEDEVILVYKDFVPLIESLKSKLPGVKKYVVLTDDNMPETSLTDLEYEKMLKDAKGEYEFPEFSENTMATLSYTTGTTGRPKGVWFTHRKLVLHTLIGALCLTGMRGLGRLKEDKEVYMPMTPMFHVHAWCMPYMAWLLGFKHVYPGRYDPRMLVKLIVTEGVTYTSCVPTILQMIVDNLPPGFKFNRLKMVIGGSRLTEGLAFKAIERGIYPVSCYGMTETAPAITGAFIKPHLLDMSEEELVRNVTVKAGIPWPLCYVRVVKEDMTDVKPDGKEAGEVVARTPWATDGYLNDEEKTKELWAGGWLHTGDIAVMDEEGYITIVDRLKDVIKSGGEWISSLTLENLLSLNPKVREAAVVGIPDEKWGERPLAIVVPMPKVELTAGELRQHLLKYAEQGVITKWAVPEKYVFVDELPKTSIGKIDKKVLRQKFR